MKNKLIISLVTLIIGVFLFGCSRTKTPSNIISGDRKTVLCTISMISDMTKQIANDRVNVCTLIKKDLDPHAYELVKGDDERLACSDLILYNGLGLEHQPNIHLHLSRHDNSHAIGDYIFDQHPEMIITTNGDLDPHIWMDVLVWSHGIDCIVAQLSKLEPSYKQEFEQRGLELKEKMQKLHIEMHTLLQSIPEHKRYLITCHDAFYYFAKSYLACPQETKGDLWRQRFIAPEGLAPDCELSTSDIEKVILFMKRNNVSTLFPEYNVNLDSIYKIREASTKSGYPVMISKFALYGDTLSQNQSSHESYLDMMWHNAETIFNQLNTEGADN